MQENSFYQACAAKFKSASIQELIDTFNFYVNSSVWTSTRSYHDFALIREFMRRGIDISSIYHDNMIIFKNKIKLDSVNKRLIIINQ